MGGSSAKRDLSTLSFIITPALFNCLICDFSQNHKNKLEFIIFCILLFNVESNTSGFFPLKYLGVIFIANEVYVNGSSLQIKEA